MPSLVAAQVITISPSTTTNCDNISFSLSASANGLAVFNNTSGVIVGNDWFSTHPQTGTVCNTVEGETFTADVTDSVFAPLSLSPGNYTIVACSNLSGAGTCSDIFYTGTTTLADALASSNVSDVVTFTIIEPYAGFIGTSTSASAYVTLGTDVTTSTESIFVLVLMALSVPLAFWILREIIALFAYERVGRRGRRRE